MSKETVNEPPKQPSSSAQVEEKETEKGEGELSESTPRGTEDERVPLAVEQSGKSEEKPPTTSQSEPKDETESTPTSGGGKGTGDSGTKVEPSPVAPASTAAVTTTEASGKSGGGEGGGGWGWGGWGKSLWSSVSTVTESAQALGQKV